jgi:hypothetical protein
VEQAILAQQLTYDEDSGARDIHNVDHRPEILEGPAKIADALRNGLMFIEQLVQRVCRLTDNAQTMGRKNRTV